MRWVSVTANNGVVALSTEARPLAISFCPNTIAENGTTLLSTAITRNGHQPASEVGSRWPSASTTGISSTAASATRTNTIVSAGSSPTAIPTNRNDPPQSTESAASSSHCVWDIAISLEDLAPVEPPQWLVLPVASNPKTSLAKK